MLTLDIFKETVEELPSDESLRRAVTQALESAAQPSGEPCELALRIVDAGEMQTFNGRYRGRDYATNVLSFPADLPEDVGLNLLGDLVICAPVVRDEANAQGKPLAAHWDHMLVHGTLHLLGYDHETDLEAEQMESLETRILAALGWPCPYEGTHLNEDAHQSTPPAAAQQQREVTAR